MRKAWTFSKRWGGKTRSVWKEWRRLRKINSCSLNVTSKRNFGFSFLQNFGGLQYLCLSNICKDQFCFILKEMMQVFKNWSKISHFVVVQVKNTKKSWTKRILLKVRKKRRTSQFYIYSIVDISCCIVNNYDFQERR